VGEWPSCSFGAIYTRSTLRAGWITAGAAALVLGVGAGSALGGKAPTKAEIEAQTRDAVAVSRARLVKLRVVSPNHSYALTVKVADPAAYLRYRAERLVSVMNRLTNVQRKFESRYFAVLDRSGSRVLWLSQHRGGGVETSRLYIRPGLADCARNLALQNEVDPEHTAPPCPR
jgi:hypothetical protein